MRADEELRQREAARCGPLGSFSRAHVSKAVWAALLRLRDDATVDADLAWSDDELSAWALYAPLASPVGLPFVFGQIGQSLDGRIATPSGDSRDISGKDGLLHLHRCRALVDAVIVGVKTAIADDPRLTVRLVPGEDPARVVVDPNGRLPADAAFFARRGRNLVVMRSDVERRESDDVIALDPVRSALDPNAIVAALAARGFRRILVEGGGATIGRFLDAGALSRLHVAISPLLVGAGPASLTMSPIETLAQATWPPTHVYGLGTDVVFDCDLSSRR